MAVSSYTTLGADTVKVTSRCHYIPTEESMLA